MIRVLILVVMLIFLGNPVSYGQGQVSRPNKSQNKTNKETNYSFYVSISELDGYINGYGYVYLGLPSGLKWAYSNLGASSPAEDGDRYARGEVTPKKKLYR